MALDASLDLQQQVREALGRNLPLRIRGGGSKPFYGRTAEGTVLPTGGHRGIVDYEPTELVITARAGTPLAEIEQTLADQGQMLAFEPPHFGPGATLGGTIATGLSGPRRPYAGAARDFVLGMQLLSGHGEIVNFGGRVIKNVAGYDVARLATGSLGMLGVILQVSLKVAPRPERERTRVLELSLAAALDTLHRLSASPLPLSGACYLDGRLYLRLSGGERGAAAACARVGGADLDDDGRFWQDLREHRLPFFASPLPLWRLSLPVDASPAKLQGEFLLDWGGAQRWLLTDAPGDIVRAYASRREGHATLFRNADAGADHRFHPLPPALLTLHRNLKSAFDPKGILNRGTMYPDL